MSNALTDLSNNIADAVDRAAQSVVQVFSHRRPAAGVVFGSDLIVAPARALGDDVAVVRLPGGQTVEGQVLGHALSMGIGVVRVPEQGLTAADTVASEPRVGSLAIAVGRTWSGAVMATVTNVAVVGGPLRTGRSRQIDRVIRIAQPPHGALSGGALVDGDGRTLAVITGGEIRGTTIAIPSTLAWDAAHQIVKRGGTRQGFLGISSTAASLTERQRGERAQQHGLLVTAVVPQSPAETGGLLVGDIILAFDGQAVDDPEFLVTLLRGNQIGKAAPLSILRGLQPLDVSVTVGERPRHRG